VALGSAGATVRTVFFPEFPELFLVAVGAFGFRFSSLGAVAPPADVNKPPNQEDILLYS
jgi:hypothetical protein